MYPDELQIRCPGCGKESNLGTIPMEDILPSNSTKYLSPPPQQPSKWRCWWCDRWWWTGTDQETHR